MIAGQTDGRTTATTMPLEKSFDTAGTIKYFKLDWTIHIQYILRKRVLVKVHFDFVMRCLFNSESWTKLRNQAGCSSEANINFDLNCRWLFLKYILVPTYFIIFWFRLSKYEVHVMSIICRVWNNVPEKRQLRSPSS